MKKHNILEYYEGSPDNISLFDDEDGSFVTKYRYNGGNVISFGYFQSKLDGPKEFKFSEKSHMEIASEAAREMIGKAMYSEEVDVGFIKDVERAIYVTASYTGRIFLTPRVVTTWIKVSSQQLAEILNKIGSVEEYKDYIYVLEENNGRDNMTVEEYINSNQEGDKRNEKYMLKDVKTSAYMTEPMIDIIRKFNTPSSKLAAKTMKLGNMTIAQYNSLLNQESKKPKKTIKENTKNMKNNKYQEEFSNYISIMTEALQKGDYKAYDYVKEMLDEAVEDSRHEDKLTAELNTNNFGILNHIFEERLPELFKSNKKVVKDVIKLVKEDQNLISQFNYYNAIKNYHGKVAEILKPEDLVQKLYEAIVPTINRETLLKSNAKFRNILKENNIIPTDFISDEMRTLYESGHNILTKKNSVANVATLAESKNNICEYLSNHKNDVIKESVDPNKLVENFENKLKDTLTESEMSFVQQITDFRSPIAEKRKEKLFNKLKEDCQKAINSMLKEDADNDELKSLSAQLGDMKFSNESIVKDIAKLLEIRDILMDD